MILSINVVKSNYWEYKTIFKSLFLNLLEDLFSEARYLLTLKLKDLWTFSEDLKIFTLISQKHLSSFIGFKQLESHSHSGLALNYGFDLRY